jgi:hypothetical protein
MNTKLTLRLDEALIRKAKSEARRRGTSVSRMTAEFIESLGQKHSAERSLPPITSSLLGILKRQRLSEQDHKRHLREKYL